MNSLITMGLGIELNNSIITYGLSVADTLIVTPVIPTISIPFSGGDSYGKNYKNFIKPYSYKLNNKTKRKIKLMLNFDEQLYDNDYELIDKYLKAKIFNIDEALNHKKIIKILIENVKDI